MKIKKTRECQGAERDCPDAPRHVPERLGRVQLVGEAGENDPAGGRAGRAGARGLRVGPGDECEAEFESGESGKISAPVGPV